MASTGDSIFVNLIYLLDLKSGTAMREPYHLKRCCGFGYCPPNSIG